jgi:hypothetical protein
VVVQLCALRWLGFVPDDLTAIPQPALLQLCDQVEANPAELDGYGARHQTRTDQLAAARTHAGFRQWDASESAALEAWLTARAMEHERPKALFTLAAEQLHVQRIARLAVDQLVRLIGAARERAHQATSTRSRASSGTALHARIPQQIGPENLDEHFNLPADLRFALKHRGERARRRGDQPVDAATRPRGDARRRRPSPPSVGARAARRIAAPGGAVGVLRADARRARR